jgi:Family of unknown function (DUF6496)
MHERKQGTLRSGRSGRVVKSRAQAIAIGLSEARRAGAQVPRKSSRGESAARKSGRKTSGRGSSARRGGGGGRSRNRSR